MQCACIAVDSAPDAAALAKIRQQTTANLSVDLQENYRLAEVVAPHVDKIRYNPGHLYHHERDKPWQDFYNRLREQFDEDAGGMGAVGATLHHLRRETGLARGARAPPSGQSATL